MRRSVSVFLGFCVLIVLGVNCTKTGDAAINFANYKPLPVEVISPGNNPQTNEKIVLGKLLFWDPILSGGKDVACATCHHASQGYTDNLDLAIGANGIGLGTLRHFLIPNNIAFTKRNTPTIVNVAFNGIDTTGYYNPATAPMFFDNRVTSLETQSLQPIKTQEEMMGHNFSAATALDSVTARLNAIPQYVQLFTDAFGDNSVTADNLSKAIACFERTMVANNSPYDQYMRGNAGAMTATQLQGMQAFQNSGCNKCHSGPMFSDYQVHVLSVPDNPKLPSDAGYNGTYAFRTPSLRNLGLTAPYMHSGMLQTLNQVLDFYDDIGKGNSQNPHVGRSSLDPKLQPTGRNKDAIIGFLHALEDYSFDKTIPASVPSGLRVGGNL